MTARSVLRLPRTVNWPFSSRACRSPDRVICRSLRTSTRSSRSWACRAMRMPEPAPAAGAAPQLSSPRAESVPPSLPASLAAVLMLPLWPAMRALLPGPPLSVNSVISTRSPDSVARRRPSRRSSPSTRARSASLSALMRAVPARRGAAARQRGVGFQRAGDAPARRRQHRPDAEVGQACRDAAGERRVGAPTASHPRAAAGACRGRRGSRRRVRCPRRAWRAPRRLRRRAATRPAAVRPACWRRRRPRSWCVRSPCRCRGW